jgi:hypothetical protein
VETDKNEEAIEVREGIQIEDGIHDGVIENVVHEKRGEEEQYDYLDVYVKLEDIKGDEVTIKTGFPAYITVNSSLGKLLEVSGLEYNVGDSLTISMIKEQLIDKKIQFKTETIDQFARIIHKTIKFVE